MKQIKRILVFASLITLMLTGCQSSGTGTSDTNQADTNTNGASITFAACQVPAIVLEVDGKVIKIALNATSNQPSGGVSTGLSGAAVPTELITGLNQEVIPPEVITSLSKTGTVATLTIANESILKNCALTDIKVGSTLIITFDNDGSITEIGLAYTQNPTTVQ